MPNPGGHMPRGPSNLPSWTIGGGDVSTLAVARRGTGVVRSLRALSRDPVPAARARQVVADEVRRRDERFLRSLDTMVWPFPASPTRRLLDAAGLEVGDVRALVAGHGLVGALAALRDAGVYVSYEEHQGEVDVVRGSTRFRLGPRDFFNPVVAADYLATTGGSSAGAGTPVEVSFAWQRRQGLQRAIQHDMTGLGSRPLAVWLPLFPSAAGLGAVMKNAAGGNTPARWFSQTSAGMAGVSSHKRLANRVLPLALRLGRTGLPQPQHVPTADPEPVVHWLRAMVDRHGAAGLIGYASSITAAARWALDHGVDLRGVVTYPSSEPVTPGKLAVMVAAGMTPNPTYAFMPEGTMAIACDRCDDEDYHLWAHEVAVVTRRRPRGDGTEVDAYCWTSLAEEAPRVLVNVENDDYGVIEDCDCPCVLGELGLRTRVRDIRGISKVVAAGVSLEGGTFDHLAEVALPTRIGGGPGDYQFVEEAEAGHTVVVLNIAPGVGPVDEDEALAVVRDVITRDEYGALAESVWGPQTLRVMRRAPHVTKAGKTLSYQRAATGGPGVADHRARSTS